MGNDKLIIKQKRARGEDGYKTFSIRLNENLVDKIEDISEESGYSRNELIGILLEYAVDNCIVEKNIK